MTEHWLPIPGYEGRFEVSDAGRVKSLDRVVRCGYGKTRTVRGRILQPIVLEDGRLGVNLPGNPRRRFRVHRLVLMAFVGPPSCGEEACHYPDPNPTNNNLSNLRWDTRRENALDSVRQGICHWSNKTHCPHDHEYTTENTYINNRGARECRTCRRKWIQKSNARRYHKKSNA